MQEQKKVFKCPICEKELKSRTTYFRHKAKCKTNNEEQDNINELKNELNELKNELNELKNINDKQTITIFKLEEKVNLLTQVAHVAPVSPVEHKSFSVKDYLNTECSNPYTIKELINNVDCDVAKIPVDGYTTFKHACDEIFNKIPLEKLPFRCSDVRRKIFYGYNDNGEWNRNLDIWKEFINPLRNRLIRLYSKRYTLKKEDLTFDELISETYKEPERREDLSLLLMRYDREIEGYKQNIYDLINYIVNRTEIIKE